MAHRKDYIPARDADFHEFFMNLINYVTKKAMGSAPVWKHIPEEALTALTNAFAGWGVAYAATQKPHTPVETKAKNRARKSSEKFLRDFVNRYLRYPPVTDEDRDFMGIPNPDKTRTPIPPPTAQVEADLVFPGIHLVELRNIRAVPGGVAPDERSNYGVRVFWGLTGPASKAHRYRVTEAPESGNDLPTSEFTHKREKLFDFDGESGNTVYFCLRYENPAGDTGPFGPMLKAVIP